MEMKQRQRTSYECVRSLLQIGGVVGVIALGSNVWAADDLDVPTKATQAGISGIDAKNMELLGWNDNQGRLAYQTTIQTQNTSEGQRVIAYVGNFNGRNLNPLTNTVEQSGTTIIDVTDPTNPVTVKHLPQTQGGGGSKMPRVCAGSDLPKGVKNHYYLLRDVGS